MQKCILLLVLFCRFLCTGCTVCGNKSAYKVPYPALWLSGAMQWAEWHSNRVTLHTWSNLKLQQHHLCEHTCSCLAIPYNNWIQQSRNEMTALSKSRMLRTMNIHVCSCPVLSNHQLVLEILFFSLSFLFSFFLDTWLWSKNSLQCSSFLPSFPSINVFLLFTLAKL